MSNSKTISISKDDSTYLLLTGNTASLSVESATQDDSIFGSEFDSSLPTLLSWTAESNAIVKGLAGYKVKLKRMGSPTLISTAQPMSLNADNGVYYITNRAQSVWAHTVTPSFSDVDGVIAASNIEYIDFLAGGVKFADAFTPNGAVTVVDFSFRATNPLCFAQTIDLTQSLAAEDTTDLCTADTNGGWAVFSPNRKTAELSLSGFYSDSSTYMADLIARAEVLIEVDLFGDGKAVARGIFRTSSVGQSGDAGSTESSDVSFTLSTPEGVKLPFTWYIATDAALSESVRLLIDAWQNRTKLFLRYRPQASARHSTGQAWVTDLSLSTGVDAIVEFSVSFNGDGALTNSVV